MIKVNKGVELHKLARLGFTKAREGVYSIQIPHTSRFEYFICIADEDIFIDVCGMYRGDESMDFEKGLDKLYFRNADKKEFVDNIIQLLVDKDIVFDTEGRYQKKDEFQKMVERFTELLPSYKCTHENHENRNDVWGRNLKELYNNAKKKGYICIGLCKEPTYHKRDMWGLVFEDEKTFETLWYHCDKITAELLYDEARVLTGKETDEEVIRYFKKGGETYVD